MICEFVKFLIDKPLSVADEPGVRGLDMKARTNLRKSFIGVHNTSGALKYQRIQLGSTLMIIDEATKQLV